MSTLLGINHNVVSIIVIIMTCHSYMQAYASATILPGITIILLLLYYYMQESAATILIIL